MEKSEKSLLIIVVILVGVLGLVGGFFLQGILIKNNTTVNQNSSQKMDSSANNPGSSNSGNPYWVNDPTGSTLVCPNCGSNNLISGGQSQTQGQLHCQYCGYSWWITIPE